MAGDSDFSLVDQWRASHGYVINTFQAWLKGHFDNHAFEIEFAQRLKRQKTVLNKLTRRDLNGQLLIRDVSTMHDFAGCRMIFNTLEDLESFRNYLHSPRVSRNVEHVLRHEPNKYNYIERPKFTGYRGIHDVYKHFPRGTARGQGKKPWDGLLVEIQYRTRAQHAWATAVEISDLIDGQNTKFELDQTKRGTFFALASEIIARSHEGISRAFATKTLAQLRLQLQALENELGILGRLAVLKQFESADRLKKHNVLNIYLDNNGDPALEVIPFSSANRAIEKASELENNVSSINAVYVRSDNPNQLRSAYRNYFNDPIDFVNIIQKEGDVEAA
ncbi:hypothetical protein A9Q95_06500 [Rhodobacterales bacterium 59_46_T64]|nr:hypothetical protein A9Q95_06500 [Rhodobacterales bacterium 59_46_T64]